MSTFKVKNGVLEIRNIDTPDIEANIMSDLQQSYRKYLQETIHEDMEYLLDELRTYQGLENIDLKIRVGSLCSQTYTKTQTYQGKYYYPVLGTFSLNGRSIGRDCELLRIPFMDDYGKINVDGASRVVLSVQRASEDISYTLKNNMFNIAMPYANVRIFASKKAIKMAYGRSRYSMEDVVTSMLYEAGDESRLRDLFRNTYLLNTFKLSDYSEPRYVYQAFTSQTDLLKKLASVQYKLGTTRIALNENLSLDRAVGEVLSRDTCGYKAGTMITTDMIRVFKRNRLNVIYVQAKELLTGYYLATEAPIIFTEIYAGTPNCALLRKKLPQYADCATIPEDVKLDKDSAIILSNSDPLTKENAEFLLIAGYTEIDVHPGKSQTVLTYSFEREIIGNYTAKLIELTDDIPEGRYADEWVYYYNNPTLAPLENDHLTAHDMLAIMSIMGQIIVTGKTPLLNRDNSFLKKVLMINEIFSETLRKASKDYVKRYHANIDKGIKDSSSSNPFFGLTKSWISLMNKERFLAPADTVNLSAEVSQVNHIVTLVAASSEVLDEQRHLAMPFFGRICPYETPAGKKLGLVNTKAMGAKIINGLLYTPYRKVISTANGIRISNKIEYLSVKDELGKKFGDMLSFVKDDAGNILNTPILARVPNPDISDEPFIFSTIKAFDLAGGYVPAYPEQFLSPTAALIPFAGSDDPVRISFGLSQIRQAIYLANSQKPRVRTPMYNDIFNYSAAERYVSPCDGVVMNITNMEVQIKSNLGEVTTIYMQGSGHQGNTEVSIDKLVKPGEKVKTGQLLAEAFKYPQPFVVRSPIDGEIVSISDNQIHINRVSSSGFINLEDSECVAINNCRIMGQSAIFINLHVSVGDRVHKGDILADTCMSRDGIYSPSRSPLVGYISIGYNYEDGVCATEKSATDYTSIIAHSIDKKISKKHYRFARANPIQGFKYCGEGDTIGTISLKDNVEDQGKHIAKVTATTKANGIPYEVKTLEDDLTSRTYRYHMVGFNRLQVGDKMAGMHGDKGVVSKLLKNSEAPQLLNGKTIDFMISPCGIPSRMNLGKMWHGALGLAAEVLQVDIDSPSFNGATDKDVEMLLQYAWIVANTPSIGDNITKQYNRAAFDTVTSSYRMLPKEFHDLVWEHIENVIDWRGAFNPDGTATVYDPDTDTYYENPIAIGYPTYLKLMQEADEKINARAGVLHEQYSRTTSQPQKADDSAKGQRMAEMELMALAASGASHFIDEIINEKSDNTGRQINNHMKQLGISARVPKEACTSRAVENLLYLLEGVGVKCEVPKDVADVSMVATNNKYKLDVRKIVQREFGGKSNYEKKVTNTESSDSFEDVAD